MSFQPAIPCQVALQHCLPPLHQPESLMLSGQPNSGAFKKCYLCLGTCVTHVLGPKTHEEGNNCYNPKTNSADPAGIATNCLPSTAKDMGLDRIAAPSCKSQSGLPFSASNAKKFPSSVPPNTRPPA